MHRAIIVYVILFMQSNITDEKYNCFQEAVLAVVVKVQVKKCV